MTAYIAHDLWFVDGAVFSIGESVDIIAVVEVITQRGIEERAVVMKYGKLYRLPIESICSG